MGGDAVFSCLSTSSLVVSIEWLVNETDLNSLQLTDVNQGFEPIGRVGTLRFDNVSLEYNNTRIQCKVYTSTEGEVLSKNSTLLIQGLLIIASALVPL